MSCKFCEEGAFNTLIESDKIDDSIYLAFSSGVVSKSDIFESDNSVVMEVRNGSGYIRLGNRGEMQCLGHNEKIEIKFCPMCGEGIE